MPSLPETSGVTGPVRLVGIVRGRDIDGSATLSMEDHALVIALVGAHPWRLDLDALDGVVHRASHVTLYLHGGDVLDITGDETLRPLALKIIDDACAMPELTRGLRAFGSLRGAPGPAHDRWFAPLLEARRSVAGVSDVQRQVALVDARRIAEAMATVIARLAAEKAPKLMPMQRAIEAALAEESLPAFKALERVALCGDAVQGSAEDTRIADWRQWVVALREAFTAADECWPRCAAVLGDMTPATSGT
jgi:hypothetical protein